MLALLDMVEIAAGQPVEVSVEEGRIVVEPRRRPRYTLAELLSRCDPDAPLSDKDREWLEAPSTGAELL
jgi:antitoxin ChpS